MSGGRGLTQLRERNGNREFQGVSDSEPAGSPPGVRGHTDSVFSTVAAWHWRTAQQPGQAVGVEMVGLAFQNMSLDVLRLKTQKRKRKFLFY